MWGKDRLLNYDVDDRLNFINLPFSRPSPCALGFLTSSNGFGGPRLDATGSSLFRSASLNGRAQSLCKRWTGRLLLSRRGL